MERGPHREEPYPGLIAPASLKPTRHSTITTIILTTLSGAYSPGLIEAEPEVWSPLNAELRLSGAYSPGLIEAGRTYQALAALDSTLSGAYSPGLIEARQRSWRSIAAGCLIRGL